MYNSNIPTDRELPSTAKLIISTIIAAVVAVILLITTVLPAEYGIDPTGIGKKLGLKKMGEIKVSLAKEAEAENVSEVQSFAQVEPEKQEVVVKKVQVLEKQDTATVTLVPDQGAEIKVKMRKGAIVTYKWVSDAGKANFDIHGDSEKLKINYHNYEKGSETVKEGSITADFDGYHGWFWRNRTDKPLTVTLDVSGDYDHMKRVK